jgi:uncharacterized membrane protein
VVYCLSAVDLFYHMTNSSLSGTAGIAIPFAVTAGALLAGERLLRACRAVLTPDEVLLETVLADSAYLIGWWWISLEVSQISGGGASASVWMSGAWSLYSAGLLAFGVFIRRRAPRQCGLALLAAAIAKVFLYDIWQFDSIYRVLSLLTLSAALWGASYLYNRCRDRILDLVLKQD